MWHWLRGSRWLVSAVAVVGAVAALPGVLSAQVPPVDVPPIDPTQFQGQVSQSLARLVVERPAALAQHAAAVAAESGQLALEIGQRVKAGQGPNGGPPPPGLEIEAAQLSASAVQCAQQARDNLVTAAQDLEKLKAFLGGQQALGADPGPGESLQILIWVSGFADTQRERNAVIDQCLQQSLLGLGRLQAYRGLFAE